MINEALLKKLKNVKSIDELIESASKEGINLSQKEADKYFNLLSRKGEMSDDELDNVSGGVCGEVEKCPSCGTGEPIWYQHRKTGEIKIGCTSCPVELDYVGGRYIVKSEFLKLS